MHVYSNAVGSHGCGAIALNSAYFMLYWPQHWVLVDISVKELLPLIVAAGLWGQTWTGYHILFHVDTMPVVEVVQNFSAQDPLLCNLLCCLYFYASYFQLMFLATHIPGNKNVAADTLSHGNFLLFCSLLPLVPGQSIPCILDNLFLLQSLDWNCAGWMTLFRTSLYQSSLPLL